MHSKLSEIPRPALVLGLGGLLPFFATALYVWQARGINDTSSSEFALHALGGYGAVILSFLGGVRWGLLLGDEARLRQWMPLTLSVLPGLVGWCSILLLPPAMLLMLIAGFSVQYALDLIAVRRLELPGWYGYLRMMLSCGAVLSLLVALVGISLG